MTIRMVTRNMVWTLALLISASATSAAKETVTWVHIESSTVVPEIFEEIARDYEAANPDVDIEVKFLENEAYKARLPTMLQSGDAPDIFYSWGGGVLAEQVRGGVVKDITAQMDDAWRANLAPSAVNAFTLDGKVYGVPVRTSLVGIYYNKDLFAKAGVDPESIKTWSDLMAAVDKFKAAGITAFSVGGAEGWPQHFFFSYLAIRTAGNETFQAALKGEGASFTDLAFVKAFELLAELAQKDAFQDGWLAAPTGTTYADLGNGDTAMLLMGDWAQALQANSSASGEGLGDKLGWIPFPQVEDGIADSKETFGGINGWLVFSGASDHAVDFLKHFSKPEYLTRLGVEGGYIPPMPGIGAKLTDPWKALVADTIEASDYHQNFYNVMFTEEVNRELLDIVTNVMTGDLTPQEGAEALQEAWEFSQ